MRRFAFRHGHGLDRFARKSVHENYRVFRNKIFFIGCVEHRVISDIRSNLFAFVNRFAILRTAPTREFVDVRIVFVIFGSVFRERNSRTLFRFVGMENFTVANKGDFVLSCFRNVAVSLSLIGASA